MAPLVTGFPCRARYAVAWRIAGSTNAVSSGSEHSHPGISPANASITNAVYVNRPVTSGTQVKSRGTVIGRRRAASADGAAGAAAVHPAAPQPEGDGHGGNDKAPDTQSPESPRRADVADQPVEVHPEKSGQDGKREEDRGHDRQPFLHFVAVGIDHALEALTRHVDVVNRAPQVIADVAVIRRGLISVTGQRDQPLSGTVEHLPLDDQHAPE